MKRRTMLKRFGAGATALVGVTGTGSADRDVVCCRDCNNCFYCETCEPETADSA